MFFLKSVVQRFGFSTSVLFFISSVLTACSGGGSGNPAANNRISATGIEYAGISEPATVTVVNANKFFVLASGSGSEAPPIGRRTSVKINNKVSKQSEPSVIRALSGSIRKFSSLPLASNQRDMGLLAAVMNSVDETIKGSVSGEMLIIGTLKNDGTGTVNVTYNNFNDGDGITFGGSSTLEILSIQFNNGYAFEMQETFATVTMDGAGFSMSVSGTIHLQVNENLNVNSDTITFNTVLRDDNTGHFSKFENLIFVQIYDVQYNPVSATINGRMYIDTEGYVDVTTTSPLLCNACTDAGPNAGGPVIIIGANGSQARFTPVSLSKTRIEIDTNGDGTFESSNSYLTSNIGGAPSPNEPPVVGAVVITPNAPRAIDTLVADTANIVDPDADPITISYTWHKNGIVLDGQSGKSLPVGSHKKGDTISVTAVISDGMHTVSVDSAIATIQDSPPTVSIAAPTAVTYGASFSVATSASDIDGDSVAYSLLYGPVGMSVDSKGVVTWIPQSLLVQDFIDVSFSVRASDGVAFSDATATVHVNAKGPDQVHVFGSPVLPTRGNSMKIADIDGDGVLEIVATDDSQRLGAWRYDTIAKTYQQIWIYPFDLSKGKGVGELDLADVNGDKRPDIIVSAGDQIVILDGKSRSIIRSIPDTHLDRAGLHVADLDGDGVPEIVFAASANPSNSYPTTQTKSIFVYSSADGSVKWQSSDVGAITMLAIGNVDTDAALEIVTPSGYVFDGATFVNQWAHTAFGSYIAVGDFNRDGANEIITVVPDNSTYPGKLVVTSYNAQTKSQASSASITSSNYSNYSVPFFSLANIDGKAGVELIFADYYATLTVLSFDIATNLPIISGSISSNYSSSTFDIATGDIDRDGVTEIVLANSSYYSSGMLTVASFAAQLALETQVPPEPTINSPLSPAGPFIGGRLVKTSTGSQQIIFGNGVSYYSTPIQLTSINPIQWVAANFSLIALPTTAQTTMSLDSDDYDGDGIDELFIGFSGYGSGGYFSVINPATAAPEWSSPTINSYQPAAVIQHEDMNDDGHSDLISIDSGGTVYVYDVLGQTVIWSGRPTGLTAPYYYSSSYFLAVGNIGGDGKPDIAVSNGSTLVILINKGTSFEELPSLSMPVAALAIGDVNRDGTNDILVAANPIINYYPMPAQLNATVSIVDGITRNVSSKFEIPGANIFDLSTRDANGRVNAVISISSSTNQNYPGGPIDITMQEYDASTGRVIWKSPTILGANFGGVSWADVNNDGYDDLIFGTSNAMYVGE